MAYNCEIDNFLGHPSFNNFDDDEAYFYGDSRGLQVRNSTSVIGTNGFIVEDDSIRDFLTLRGYSNIDFSTIRFNRDRRVYMTAVFEDGTTRTTRFQDFSNLTSPLSDYYFEFPSVNSIEIMFSATFGSETVTSPRTYTININNEDGTGVKIRTNGELVNILRNAGFTSFSSTAVVSNSTPIINCENATTGEALSTNVVITPTGSNITINTISTIAVETQIFETYYQAQQDEAAGTLDVEATNTILTDLYQQLATTE